MIIGTPAYTAVPEHVVITPTTSLQLYLEMDLHLHRTKQLPSSAPSDAKTKLPDKKRTQHAIVICGFPAIGKSTFKAANEAGYRGYRVEDMDSSLFAKGPEWPKNYLDAVSDKIGERCILMISMHRLIYTSLIESGVDLVLVYPQQGLKTEWLGRITKRGMQAGDSKSGRLHRMVEDNWDRWLREYKEQDGCLSYEMSGREYLLEATERIVDLFETEFLLTKSMGS